VVDLTVCYRALNMLEQTKNWYVYIVDVIGMFETTFGKLPQNIFT